MKTFKKQDEGFALIITISLMAFLVLLLVTLTTMTRVETQLASNSQQMHAARENARMALGVAVGQLQRYAGLDFAVTARADIEGTASSNDLNPHWTGVWDDPNTGGGFQLLTWLVSGNEDPDFPLHFKPENFDYDRTMPDPYRTPGDPPPDSPAPTPLGAPNGTGVGVRLVGAGTGYADPGTTPPNQIMEGVVVPLIPIHAPNNTYPGLTGTPVVGHYAYWVGDQGIKASMAKTERHWDLEDFGGNNPWDYSVPEIRRLRQLLPQRFGHSEIFSNLAAIENDANYMGRLARVQSFHQMRLALRDNATPSLIYLDFRNPARDALRTHFHDLTQFNMGVLASTAGHGLKADLSTGTTGPREVREFMAAGYPVFPALSPLLGDDPRPPYNIGRVDPLVDLQIAPVVTELLFKYSVWAEGPATGARVLQIRLSAEVELWNPYNATLRNERLWVVLRDSSDSEPWVTVYHNDDLIGDLSTVGSGVAAIGFNTGSMAPGVVREVPLTPIQAVASDESGTPLPPLGTPEDGDPDELWLERPLNEPFENLQVELRMGLTLETSNLLATYELEDFNGFTLTDARYNPNDDTAKFGFYVRMRDAEDREDWLTFFDPRDPLLQDQNDNDPAVVWDPFETEPDVEEGAFIAALNSLTIDLLRPQNTVILFELPTQEVVNMGSLQHVFFPGYGAYALGNPWGDGPAGPNNLFDSHFISTIPQDPAWMNDATKPPEFRFPVPHTGMIPYRGNGNDPYNPLAPNGTQAPPLQSAESARHLLLKGMFNINSTSVDAWRSVLSSLNVVDKNPIEPRDEDWEYGTEANGGTGDSTRLQNAVFRFSQTAHIRNAIPKKNPNELEDVAWVQGVRADLDSDDIDILAQEIVFQLRDYGEPFPSLAAFINSGRLQDAIDDSGINGKLTRYSPAFITQADIITLLAPFMLARSDTFLVRAYGNTYNPVTGAVEGEAWCEAIVQRVPTPFDVNDQNNNFVFPTDNRSFGRKFEIVYFRWLDASEL